MTRFLLCALLAVPAWSETPSRALQRLFDSYSQRQAREFPEEATFQGRHEFDHLWTDQSKVARQHRREEDEEDLARAHGFDHTDLPAQDRLSLRVFEYMLATEVEGQALGAGYLGLVQQQGGRIHTAPFLVIDAMPSRTVSDYQNIISRLNGIPSLIDQQLARLQEAINAGLMQPRLVVDLTAAQVERQFQMDAAHTPLLAAFRRFPDTIPVADRQRLSAEARTAYETKFVPAWKRLHQFLITSYAAKCRPALAATSLPNGRTLYAYYTRRMTTTSMTPEEIHKLGLAEVARLEKEMQAVAAESGFHGSLADFDKFLASRPDQHFTSKEEMLIDCRDIVKRIEPELPRLFTNLPRLIYGIRAIPADREASTATNAQFPSTDGSRPGWVNLNTYRPERQNRFDKEDLMLHEAVPGHVYQGSVQVQLANLPDFRRHYGNSAYAEGWALYAESLGPELGMYRTPYTRYGGLVGEQFRAVRLVLDTGIHSFGWSREKAMVYFKEHAPSQSPAEVDRYIAWPGQALAYKIGQLKFVELRRRAEKELGPKFDVREFHDVVLRNGSLPLAILEDVVSAYIAGRKAAAK